MSFSIHYIRIIIQIELSSIDSVKHIFYNFDIISTRRRVWLFIWKHLNHHHPSMLRAKFGWNWSSGSEEDDFLSFQYNFNIFAIISPWERVLLFIRSNVNPLHPMIFCAKFGWNWPSGSWEKEENVKSLQTDRQTDGQTTDKKWSEKPTWAFSSGGLKNFSPILDLPVVCF